MIKTGLLAAVFGLVIGASTAEAAPLNVAPLAGAPPAGALAQPAVATGGEAAIVLVRGGCGWGAHRTWRGTCHLNYGWRGRVRAMRRWGWRRW